MANLKAHGAELARVKCVRTVLDPTDVVSERITRRALLRDGVILQKEQVRWRSNQELHDYGWKRYARIRADMTPRQWTEKYLAAKTLTWQVEQLSNLSPDKPVIVSDHARAIARGQTTFE